MIRAYRRSERRLWSALVTCAAWIFAPSPASAGWGVEEEPLPVPAASDPGAVAADPDVPEDLARYLAMALDRSPELAAAQERMRAAAARVPQLEALPEPQLRYTWLPRAIQTRTGPQRHRIGVTQALPWWGQRRSSAAVGSRMVDRLDSELEARAVAIVHRVTLAYYDYAWLGEDLRVTRDSLELLQQLEPVVQRKIQGGASQEDLLRLQMEIGRTEDRLATLERRRPSASARITAELDATDDPVLPWPQLEIPEPTAPDLAALWRTVLAHNPDLQVIEGELDQADAGVDLARFASKPSFAVGFELMETGAALMPGTRGSSTDPFALNAMITLPVWRGKYRAALAESAARRSDVELRATHLRNQLWAQTERAWFELDDAVRKLDLYRDTLIPRARQTLALTQRSYQAGGASLLDWIGTERELIEFDRSLLRAAADYYQRRADIESLCGGRLPAVPEEIP